MKKIKNKNNNNVWLLLLLVLLLAVVLLFYVFFLLFDFCETSSGLKNANFENCFEPTIYIIHITRGPRI